MVYGGTQWYHTPCCFLVSELVVPSGRLEIRLYQCGTINTVNTIEFETSHF
jgi:hypothetical protein